MCAEAGLSDPGQAAAEITFTGCRLLTIVEAIVDRTADPDEASPAGTG